MRGWRWIPIHLPFSPSSLFFVLHNSTVFVDSSGFVLYCLVVFCCLCFFSLSLSSVLVLVLVLVSVRVRVLKPFIYHLFTIWVLVSYHPLLTNKSYLYSVKRYYLFLCFGTSQYHLCYQVVPVLSLPHSIIDGVHSERTYKFQLSLPAYDLPTKDKSGIAVHYLRDCDYWYQLPRKCSQT